MNIDLDQNLHLCVSLPVDWGLCLLWESPSLIFVLIIIADYFSAIFCGKTAETDWNKIGTKIGTEIGTIRGSAVLSVNLPPVFLARSLWFSDKLQQTNNI